MIEWNKGSVEMTKMALRCCLVMVMVSMVGCASLLGPRDFELPLSTLQSSLEKRFPFNNRYLGLFDIQLSAPRLDLQTGSNRIVTSFDAAIAPAWLKRSWQGNFALSGELAIDSVKNAVILTDPRVESLNIAGLDDRYAKQLQKVSGIIAEELFRGMPLYTFQPTEFRYGGTSFLPTKINTRGNGLVVTFEPVK
ncbi:DUF1439 domain-containing protein [Janthinobacterium sp. 17J80-10]|uniref:DUF1439 domain-containing protein n=1 Tax=Janthinobacterium sp. 17J80-10 TaxID=2497863 RepID=UPI00100554C4|nr:DUF1439 domain-containing protein [Janthinobacterium sp. 17J80-10]QAU33576.1 DUF1439 domain-containing protein [Janthinobacterium sp. 17J80-10]